MGDRGACPQGLLRCVRVWAERFLFANDHLSQAKWAMCALRDFREGTHTHTHTHNTTDSHAEGFKCIQLFLYADLPPTCHDPHLFTLYLAGGWLHLHENVLDVEEARWVAEAAEALEGIARGLPGREAWEARVR